MHTKDPHSMLGPSEKPPGNRPALASNHSDRRLAGLAISLTAIATLMFQWAVAPGQDRPALSLLELGAVLAVLMVIAQRLRRNRGKITRVAAIAWLPGTAVAVMLQPFVWERLKELFLGPGEPYDTQIAYATRNLMWALLLLPFPAACVRLAAVASMILLLFAYSLRPDVWGLVFVTLYGACGTCFLSSQHWAKIQQKAADTESPAYPHLGLGLLVMFVAMAMLGGGIMTRNRQVLAALPQLFPSSGGDSRPDPRAKSGINDGDTLVQGRTNADSFGPVESELFLESDEPSLYDIFQDSFDIAKKPPKTERAVALPSRDIPHKDHRIAEHQQAAQEFTTHREQTQRKDKPLADRKSPELLQVLGPAPVHLRTHVYNAWDGVAWKWVGNPFDLFPQMESLDGKPWIRTLESSVPPLELRQLYQYRFINYADHRIPEPEHIAGAHVDQVDQPDMYTFCADGVLAMARERIPRMTVMHVMSGLPTPRDAQERFAAASYSMIANGELVETEATSSEKALLRALAQAWTQGLPRGWTQIEAIETRLQNEYLLDPSLRVPDGASSATWFLRDSKAGPDYLFATSATLLLRELGYHARTVAGFYVRKPTDSTKTSRVSATDVHLWTEVSSDGITWRTVEPCPGYPRAGEQRSFWSYLVHAFYRAKRALWQNRISLAIVLAATGGLLLLRRQLIAVGIFCWWHIRILLTSPKEAVEATVMLLHRLDWLGRRGRDQSATLQNWLGTHPWFAARPQSVRTFLSLADRTLYGPQVSRQDALQVRHACREVAKAAMFSSYGKTPKFLESSRLMVASHAAPASGQQTNTAERPPW